MASFLPPYYQDVYCGYMPSTMLPIQHAKPIEEMSDAEVKRELANAITTWENAMKLEDDNFLANSRRQHWFAGGAKEMYLASLRGDLYLMHAIIRRDRQDTVTKQANKFLTITDSSYRTHAKILSILVDIPDAAKQALLTYDFQPQLRTRQFVLPPTPPSYHDRDAVKKPVEYSLALCHNNGSNPTMAELTLICNDVEQYCDLIKISTTAGSNLGMNVNTMTQQQLDLVISMESYPRHSAANSLTQPKAAMLAQRPKQHTPRWPNDTTGDMSTVNQARELVRAIRQRLQKLITGGWQPASLQALPFTVTSAGWTVQVARRAYEYERPQGVNGALKMFNAAALRHGLELSSTLTVVNTPWNQVLAPMGEHVVTVLSQGYAGQCGLNVTAAGVQVKSIRDIQAATWNTLERNLRNSAHYNAQFDAVSNQITSVRNELGRAKTLTALRKRLITLKQEHNEALTKKSTAAKRLDDLKVELDQELQNLVKRLKEQNHRLETLRRSRNRLEHSEKRVINILNSNGYVPFATPHPLPQSTRSSRQTTPVAEGMSSISIKDLLDSIPE